ncbi:RNA recognition motif domain-containing protein [Bdellovibrio sp. HCB290]|uniref:RNA recognition motif domain-containing protein n=1 Tax=Bdellovibrio sp. HCB290 TaxID=3394356 RepID=UPI0039B40721
MAKKLYVGNLPYTVDDETLHNHFAQFGAVDSAKVIMDRETGRSKGFGFVEMSDDSAADAAIEKGNGIEINGRPLNISEARPQAPREGGGGPRRGGFNNNRGGGNGGGRRDYGNR